jgi:transposase InsO family protein
MKDEKKESAVAFLKAAVAYYASLGVKIERVMTDNGSCYRSKAFAHTCKTLGLEPIRTKPYTPKTNGKAERFIQDQPARMGLRPRLQHLGRTRRRTAQMAPPLQLASAPCQYRHQTTHQPPRPNREQPVEAPRLAGPRRH